MTKVVSIKRLSEKLLTCFCPGRAIVSKAFSFPRWLKPQNESKSAQRDKNTNLDSSTI